MHRGPACAAFPEPVEVLSAEDMSTWDHCKQKVVDLGVEEAAAETVLRESFAWKGKKYWGAEKVRDCLIYKPYICLCLSNKLSWWLDVSMSLRYF